VGGVSAATLSPRVNDQQVVLDRGITDRTSVDGRGLLMGECGVWGEVSVLLGCASAFFHAGQELGPLVRRDRGAPVPELAVRGGSRTERTRKVVGPRGSVGLPESVGANAPDCVPAHFPAIPL
jgi:hypothetical protein